MVVGIADTHAIIWYLYDDTRLSMSAGAFIDHASEVGDHIGISSITYVELVYLIEKGRIPVETFSRLASIISSSASSFVEQPIDVAIARTMARIDVTQIPDMPDRIIAATAAHLNVPLISRDRRIQLSGLNTIW